MRNYLILMLLTWDIFDVFYFEVHGAGVCHLFERLAVTFHGALAAAWVFRRAYCSSQFHHRLVEVPRSVRINQVVGIFPVCFVGCLKSKNEWMYLLNEHF